MARSVFIPDLRSYEHFYSSQDGGGAGAFDGYLLQEGYGIGNILGKLFKMALPILKKGVKFAAPHAGRFGRNVLSDLESGHPLSKSLRSRSIESLNNVGSDISSRLLAPQEGRGRVRKRRRTTIKRKQTKRRKSKPKRKPIKRKSSRKRSTVSSKRRRVRLTDIFG